MYHNSLNSFRSGAEETDKASAHQHKVHILAGFSDGSDVLDFLCRKIADCTGASESKLGHFTADIQKLESLDLL